MKKFTSLQIIRINQKVKMDIKALKQEKIEVEKLKQETIDNLNAQIKSLLAITDELVLGVPFYSELGDKISKVMMLTDRQKKCRRLTHEY